MVKAAGCSSTAVAIVTTALLLATTTTPKTTSAAVTSPAFLSLVSKQSSTKSALPGTLDDDDNHHVDIVVANTRRAFLTSAASAAAAATVALPAMAAPEIYNTKGGVKYAITKAAPKGSASPQSGDIVAIEYTGYLTSGQIFDSTHAEGKSNVLVFKVGTGSVIPGLDDVVLEMSVGEKVQAIIPPALAYGEKGVCLDDGECLIRPGSTLVYDVFLKKSSIPPP